MKKIKKQSIKKTQKDLAWIAKMMNDYTGDAKDAAVPTEPATPLTQLQKLRQMADRKSVV